MSYLSSSSETEPVETAPNAAIASTAAIAAFVMLIGLSAADIHWGDRPESVQSAAWERDGRQLDGRGKWAGYLKP